MQNQEAVKEENEEDAKYSSHDVTKMTIPLEFPNEKPQPQIDSQCSSIDDEG